MNLENLNPEQQAAVRATEGPVLVLAGAGSGKTKVLTTRIAYLVGEKNVLPENILAITFTNKAAKEMKNRVVGILGPVAFQIQISTFHSFGLRIMQENYANLGYQKNFTILDSDDTLTIIKKIMKDLNLEKDYNPRTIKSMISSAKNELISASEYERFANGELANVVYEVYRRYEHKLTQNNSLDFDDLLFLPIMLFRQHPEILKQYQELFHYILIDEYQDTNEAQYLLVKMLSAKYKNIFVVGDVDQSIYGFRGSNYRNILNFEKDYPGVKTILLEENYRSTKNILGAANDVIKNNKERKDKNLWTENEEGVKIKYHRSENESDEAYYTVKEIRHLIDHGTPRSEIAVLYRTNAQSRTLEEAMLRENIPYKIVGSFYFYKRKEIKDLICYLKLIYNPLDDVSLLRIINIPKRGIGLKTIQDLTEKANRQGCSLYEAIDGGKELAFKTIIEELIAVKDRCSLTELVDEILNRTGMRAELVKEKNVESEIRLENLEEFKSITQSFEHEYGLSSLEDFLMEISLVADIEEHKDHIDVVTLMTIHSAKGLEFDNVFIVGLEEGIFPHNNSLTENNLEEERRLCYVAITRARKKLWLINARRRMLYGITNENVPSRFLKEISDSYLDIEQPMKAETSEFRREEQYQDVEYTVGNHIYFDKYGEGVIVSMGDKVISVAFRHPHGVKTLIKGHKSIRKVD